MFPPVCFICDQKLLHGRRIVCEPCFNAMPQISDKSVLALQSEMASPYVTNLYIKYEFASTFQQLIHLFKYEHHLTLARYFGAALSSTFFEDINNHDLMVPVPLYKTRERERGYNQSAMIAAEIAGNTGIKFRNDVLMRFNPTKSQATLNRKQRIENVQNAFGVSDASIAGKRIIIIDDVITTGSTLNACAKVLFENNAKQISLMALATPPFAEII